MLATQLDFFKTDEECEMDALRKSVNEIRLSSDKVRKGTYASINSIKKECDEVKIRLEILERNICNGR